MIEPKLFLNDSLLVVLIMDQKFKMATIFLEIF